MKIYQNSFKVLRAKQKSKILSQPVDHTVARIGVGGNSRTCSRDDCDTYRRVGPSCGMIPSRICFCERSIVHNGSRYCNGIFSWAKNNREPQCLPKATKSKSISLFSLFFCFVLSVLNYLLAMLKNSFSVF